MGALTRAFNWAATSIGKPESWTQSHLTSVNMMLTSRFPMLVFWGPDLITFYNDAFRPSLGNDGKHPGSLGQPGHISWAESWPVIGPMINNIMNGGEAVWFEDQKLPLYRDGKMGYAYWTYSFSPLLDDDGQVGGVLVTCNETTKSVESTARLAESENRFQNLVREATIGIVVLEGEAWHISIANEAFAKLIGRSTQDIMGKNLFELLPEARSEFEPIMQSVYRDGKSIQNNNAAYTVQDKNGQTIEGYVNVLYQPFREEDGTITGIIEIIQDVTDKVKAELQVVSMYENEKSLHREIAESEERFRNMAESTDVLIAVSNEKAESVYFNKAWERFTGRSQQDLLGFGWTDMIHPEDRERFVDYYMESFKKQEPFANEFRLKNNDGNYRWQRVLGPPRFRPDGSFAGYISSCFDITEQKQDELRKNDFIAMVSHELKTPLTSISGFLQLLEMDAKKNNYGFSTAMTAKARRQVGKMITMINGFLNVSRLEAGKLDIHKTRFDMADLLQEIQADADSLYPGRKLVFDPVEHTIVEADWHKIENVISNFLSNAVKYAPNGSIQIACVQKDNLVEVSVADAGIGIRKEDLGKIFDRYYRIEQGLSDNGVSGFGIGLYLCAEIIQRHNGKIWAESEPGEGAVFYFTLPRGTDLTPGPSPTKRGVSPE